MTPPAALDGWPGVFRPLRHRVSPDARCLLIRGVPVWFAVCGSPCRPPGGDVPELEPCARCAAVAAR